MKKARSGLALCLTTALGLVAPAATAAEAPTESEAHGENYSAPRPLDPLGREEIPEGIEGAQQVFWENSLYMVQIVEMELGEFSDYLRGHVAERDFEVDHILGDIPGILEREQAIGNHLIKVAQATVADGAEALSS